MSDDIKAIIESVVRERLSDELVKQVIIEEDRDELGDLVLRVTVVFDPAKGQLDPHRLSGLTRHTRSRLGSSDSFPRPVFRFISQSEAGKFLSAAA